MMLRIKAPKTIPNFTNSSRIFVDIFVFCVYEFIRYRFVINRNRKKLLEFEMEINFIDR